MVTPSVGAAIQIPLNRLDTVTDGLGKKLNFKEQKEGSGILEAKGKDGNTFYADTKDVLVTITAVAAIDNKEARKRNPGTPIPRDEAKKIDEEIKKEKEEEEAKTMSDEQKSFQDRAKREEDESGRVKVPEPQGKSKGR